MLAVAALVLHTWTPDLRFDAAPVSRVVAALARATGEPLAVAPAVGREIVALNLPAATTRDTMRWLAEGLHAVWRTQDGRPTLVRTDAQLAAERREFEATRLRALRLALEPKRLPPFDVGRYVRAVAPLLDERRGRHVDPALVSAAEQAQNDQGPRARFESRLRMAFSPEFVIGLGEGQAVFHSRPNRRQLPLTPALAEAYRLYQEESAELAAAESEPAPPAAPLLEVIAQGWESHASVRYRALDERRCQVESAWPQNLEGDYGFASDLVPQASDVRLDGEPDPPETRDERTLARRRDRALDLSLHDPLSEVGNWLVRCAQSRGEGLVAVMGDDLLAAMPPGRPEVGRWLAELPARGYSAREHNGLLWVAPLDRSGVRARQADRDVLKGWLDGERAGRRLSIADYFRLSSLLPSAGDGFAMVEWLRQVGVEAPDWNTKLLSVAAAVPCNRTVRLGDLPHGAREALRGMVENSLPGDYWVRLAFVCGNPFMEADDPTDVLPLGVSDDASVRLDETRAPCFVYGLTPRGASWFPACWTVEELAESSAAPYDDLPVRVGFCHRIDLTVDVGGGQTYRDRIEAVEGLGSVTRVAKLPEPLMSAVRKAQAREGK